MVSVQPNSDVFSRPFVHAKVGSLRDQSITDIWQAPLLQRARGHGPRLPGRSVIHTGRPDVPDPTYHRGTEELLASLPPDEKPAKAAATRTGGAATTFISADGLSLASHNARATKSSVDRKSTLTGSVR